MSISTLQSCRSGLAHLTPRAAPRTRDPLCNRTVFEASIHAGLRLGGDPNRGRTVQVFESAASAALEIAPPFRNGSQATRASRIARLGVRVLSGSSRLEQPIAFAVGTDAFDAQPASRRPGCRGGRPHPKRNLILVLSTAGPLHRSARR